MSWSFDTLEQWVKTALLNIGYTESEALLGAHSVTWLQQRRAPGVAAIAQHIDFLSAYQFTPKHGGDANAVCPIKLSATLKETKNALPQSFKAVRQPLLLLPTLAQHADTVRWNDFELELRNSQLNIEYERKTLRQVLIEKTDVHWQLNTSQNAAPSNCHPDLAAEIPSRELVYVKTLQHYAGTLPPREALDGAPTTDNPFAKQPKKLASIRASDNTSSLH